METLKIDTNSWHYKLLVKGHFVSEWDFQYNGGMTSCEYNSALLRFFFTSVALTGIFLFMAFLLALIFGEGIAWFVFIAINGVNTGVQPSELGTGFVIFSFLGSLVGAGWATMQYIITPLSNVDVVPSATKELYKSWKEKHCRRIELVSH